MKNKKRKIIICSVIIGLVLIILSSIIVYNTCIINNISAVKNFKVKENNATSVTLKWDKVMFANKYLLFRATQEHNSNDFKKYKKIALTDNNVYLDNELKQSKQYKYKIYACVSIKNKIISKSPSKEIEITTAPEKIKKITITETTSDTIKLKWSNNSKPNHYIIKRISNNTKKKFFKKVNSKTFSYTDKKLSSGTIYHYQITPVLIRDTIIKGRPIAISKMTKISAPSSFKKANSTYNKIKLKWDAVDNADNYELYRDDKLISTLKDTSYTDKNLKNGSAFKYKIRTTKQHNGITYKSEFKKLNAFTNVKVPTVKGGLSGSWVEININKQEMKMFVDNKLYVETPVVTGNIGQHSTTKGHHTVIGMKSPARLKGDGWDVVVNYWLKFTYDGQGIHDSTWRSGYGGSIYMGNGSHGCVNTPFEAVKKIYSKGYVGMPVIIY